MADCISIAGTAQEHACIIHAIIPWRRNKASPKSLALLRLSAPFRNCS
jgi:hypothetical protein